MSRKIIISKTAEKKLEIIFKYLTDKWSPKVKKSFIEKLDKCLELIKENPESFPESEKNSGLRKCVITKHNTLYYRFNDHKIQVVTVFDNRQNPIKIRKDIS